MKNNKTKKKPNSYLRFLGIVLLAAFVGGIIGGIIGAVSDFGGKEGWSLKFLVDILQKWQLPVMGLIFIISVPWSELILCRLKKLQCLLETAQDEEADRLEYEEEKYGSVGIVSSNVFLVLALLNLSVTYNRDYIEAQSMSMLLSCGLLILIYVYQGIWQIRYVKLVQKANPKLKGDPGCMRQKTFQKEWLNSCDEAEKELIYQSGYEAYIGIARILPLLAMLAMLSHLMWSTGIFAVVMIGVIWIWITVLYCRNCVSKRRNKINI